MDAPPVAENAEQPKFSEIKQPGNDTLKWSDLPETIKSRLISEGIVALIQHPHHPRSA